MDLRAYIYSQADDVSGYVERHYGHVPRLRGISLMKFEKPGYAGHGPEGDAWDRHCGEDVIYIHTRCGSAHWGDDDPDANYIACGAEKWEKDNADTFIESVNEDFDGTYRSHYFRAVPGDDYDKLCKEFEAAMQETDAEEVD